MKDKEEIKEPQKTTAATHKGVRRKKKVKKRKMEERLSGLILLLVTVFVGFVLWVSGERGQERLIERDQQGWVEVERGGGVEESDEGVIILR